MFRARFGCVAVTASLSTLLPLTASPAAAALPAPPPVDISWNACASGVPDAGYRDLEGTPASARLAIDCITGYGIAQGSGGGYNRTAPVNRSQMALFLTRFATVAGVALDDREAGFTDVGGESEAARRAINQIANLSVANGLSPRTYGPGAGVSRAQMASFLNRLQARIDGGTSSFTSGADYFTDDGGSSERDINAVTSVGLAGGTAVGAYSPKAVVTRQQMAAFLARDLQVNVLDGNLTSRYAPTAPVVLKPGGLLDPIGADQPASRWVAYLSSRFGSPKVRDGRCGDPRFGEGRELTFQDSLILDISGSGGNEVAVGWAFSAPENGTDQLGLKTERGVGVGNSLSELRRLYPDGEFNDNTGVEYYRAYVGEAFLLFALDFEGNKTTISIESGDVCP